MRLWDGGAYENQGLEALYKPGDEGSRSLEDIIVVSDASAPLPEDLTLLGSLIAIFRGNLSSPRLFDISADQIRSLRTRMFIQDVKAGRVNGALLRMGKSVRALNLRIDGAGVGEQAGTLSDQSAQLAGLYPTCLKRTVTDAFDLIAQHGFEVADTTLNGYKKLLRNHVNWPDDAVTAR